MVTTHPKGIYTLFFTEMWERFSYYGMRGILVLFLIAQVQTGGMGLDDKTATAIYGLYTACVYLFALPGGWVADRILGLQRAVMVGGAIIATGHFCLALPYTQSFFLGLVLIAIGTGLLKPSISGIVGELYPQGGAERDAGYYLYYMGINLGAMIGPIICGFLGEKINWHYGFAASGIGMVAGLVQFRLQIRTLKHAGDFVPQVSPRTKQAFYVFAGLLLFILGTAFSGAVMINPLALAQSAGVAMVCFSLCYFAYLYWGNGLNRIEKKHVLALCILSLFSTLFWAGFEQGGSSFNLFAERYTDRFLFDYEFPASWLLMFSPMFILVLAPIMTLIWRKLAVRDLNPTAPAKFVLALLMTAFGFGVMVIASKFVLAGEKVLPTWLISTYFLHTMADLLISPIGLSLISQLSPKRLLAQMMGLYFIALAGGNLVAGLLAGHMGGTENPAAMIPLFQNSFYFCAGATLLLFLLKPVLLHLMAGNERGIGKPE